MNKKYSDQELLEGIGRNDIKILNHIYDISYRPIRYLVISNNGKEQDAEDVFQEALVVVFIKIREENFQLSSSLTTYLYSVARIIWIRELNNRKVRAEFIEGEQLVLNTTDSDIELLEESERYKLYREKFEELSEDCKKVLKMFLINIPIKDITAIMGYSSDQHTKNRRFRCKKTLINNIRNSKEYKKLGYENNSNDRGIPRW
ncbi:MAG: sigma-70 family RNA polymerase sigma factor [Bacteroidales bacterium]|nr:sigma-70 family RNA polymerase sigma factor [Bacteroidales bacterium]